MNDVLLIDGDVLIYEACKSSMRDVRFGWQHILWADADEVKAWFDNQIVEIQETLATKTTHVAVALSYYQANGGPPPWRKVVWPDYKGTRTDPKPPAFWACRRYVLEKYGATVWEGLEADDVLGIWATGRYKGRGIIVSIDKDLYTIPGRFCRWPKKKTVEEISEKQADHFHLIQSLSGDTVDGYKGCPGYGPIKSKNLLGSWPDDSATCTTNVDKWKKILTAYAEADMSEDDALRNAQLARILRADEYNEETGEVQLWQGPSKPTQALLSC